MMVQPTRQSPAFENRFTRACRLTGNQPENARQQKANHDPRSLVHACAFTDLEMLSSPSNDQAQRPPPETLGRLQQSRTIYLNRPTAQRGGG